MLTKVYFSPTFLLSNKHKCIIFRVVQFPFQNSGETSKLQQLSSDCDMLSPRHICVGRSTSVQWSKE